MSSGSKPLASLLGADLQVPVYGGGTSRYINLDNAATTPPLQRVWNKLAEVMPWYGSIHRGAGFKSVLSTRLFEKSLEQIFDFSNGHPERDALVFGTNTTFCANHLARRLNLDRDSLVITSEAEHTSNVLPWRKHATVTQCQTSTEGVVDIDHLESILKKRGARLVAVTAASNVTGAIVDVHSIARVAHEYGAQVFVDAAQLVAHRKLDRRPFGEADHLDFVAYSGHKMYAPFGAGVLVGDRECFSSGWPDVAGGGTVRLIDGDEIIWADLPGREQGGTPNFAGVVALAEAAATLTEIGFDSIAEHEQALIKHAKDIFSSLPDVTPYQDFNAEGNDSVAVFPFSVRGHHHSLVGAFLGIERAIGVRAGHLCQHEMIRRFLNISEEERAQVRREVQSGDSRNMYGIVRASCGLGTTTSDLDALAGALSALNVRSMKAEYRQSLDGEYHAEGWTPHTIDTKVASFDAAML